MLMMEILRRLRRLLPDWLFENRLVAALCDFVKRIVRWMMIRMLGVCRIRSINDFEARKYSQNGEDGIIEAIFARIGAESKFFVEIGVGPPDGRLELLDTAGLECNTRLLREKGWQGYMFDGREYPENAGVKTEFVTVENINSVFQKYAIPVEFDLLSIDIDGNDYWVWKALGSYRPRVVIVEYNSNYPPPERRVLPYDPAFRWDGTDYYGASLSALVQLAKEKGYTLVGCDNNGINSFFVADEYVAHGFVLKSDAELYRPPHCGADGLGHPRSSKKLDLI